MNSIATVIGADATGSSADGELTKEHGEALLEAV